MKYQPLHLSIKKPCSENFGAFRPTDTGGFCSSCQKDVIDFTKMSEAEVLAYFENRQEKTCGRFHPSQLKSYP